VTEEVTCDGGGGIGVVDTSSAGFSSVIVYSFRSFNEISGVVEMHR
jgi:hypothetical protein